jgi:hypothetical protein
MSASLPCPLPPPSTSAVRARRGDDVLAGQLNTVRVDARDLCQGVNYPPERPAKGL